MPYKDKEKARACQRRWEKANTEKIKIKKLEWRMANLERVRNQSKEWRAANPEVVKGIMWKRQYGLSVDDVNKMMCNQNGKCFVCGIKLEANGRGPFSAQIDHDHATGWVRGLLCRSCNCAIGHAKESVDRLRKCADYLETWAAITGGVDAVAPQG